MNNRGYAVVLSAIIFGIVYLVPYSVFARSDAIDGPIVKDCKAALEKADVLPVLKWVNRENEVAVCEAFNKALSERKKSAQDKELADRGFFETVVRLHLEGRGKNFQGLQPAEAIPNLASLEAELGLEKGSSETLEKLLSDVIIGGVRERFNRALEKKEDSASSIDAAREYAQAYLNLMEYVERLFSDATSADIHKAISEKKECTKKQ